MSEEVRFLNGEALPFCKGCGHHHIASSTEKALQKCGLDPLDVVLVTDIGCHGIIDKSFVTHTVHGLHGRSVALASGITASLNDPSKKVIVFIGDGGATIGMQHLINAAHNRFNMTVVIHNNMLYGMTGGQCSEFTPLGFKTPTLPEGAQREGYDICRLMAAVEGVSYLARLEGIGDFSDQLAKAFAHPGFSLVEVMEICPSYGVKSNPGIKLSNVIEEAGLKIKTFVDEQAGIFDLKKNHVSASLLDDADAVDVKYLSKLESQVRIMLSGSAGEGVQGAAEMLLEAAMTAGLNATKKGSYPVTVGVGFSAAELILSPVEILYTGSPEPDLLCVTSQEGLDYSRKTIEAMQGGTLFIDSSLGVPATGARVIRFPFRDNGGAKSASVYAVFYMLHQSGLFPVDALKEIFSRSRIASKINLENMFRSFTEKNEII